MTVYLLLFVLPSCSSGQGDEVDFLLTEVKESPETTLLQTYETKTTEAAGNSSGESTEVSPTDASITGADGSGDMLNQNIDIFTDKKIKIEQVNTIYSDISAGTINLELDWDTGEIAGFIFLGYMEVKLRQGKSYPCENVMKGYLTGFLDEDSGGIGGEIKSEIDGEGRECFNGPVILEFTGRLIEGGKLIEGVFNLPSGNRLYFLLEKEAEEQ